MNTHDPVESVVSTRSPAVGAVDRESFTIGVLGIPAALLFVGLMLTWGKPQRAYAIGQNASGGDFVMLTQQFTNTQESLILIDAAAERLIVYGYDYSRRVLLPVDGFDLRNLQKRPEAQPPSTPGRKK